VVKYVIENKATGGYLRDISQEDPQPLRFDNQAEAVRFLESTGRYPNSYIIRKEDQ